MIATTHHSTRQELSNSGRGVQIKWAVAITIILAMIGCKTASAPHNDADAAKMESPRSFPTESVSASPATSTVSTVVVVKDDRLIAIVGICQEIEAEIASCLQERRALLEAGHISHEKATEIAYYLIEDLRVRNKALQSKAKALTYFDRNRATLVSLSRPILNARYNLMFSIRDQPEIQILRRVDTALFPLWAIFPEVSLQ